MSSSSGEDVRLFLEPAVKITTFDNLGGATVGVSAGSIQGGKLLFGVGFHTLAFGSRARRNLTYGGVLVGWVFGQDTPVVVTARTLVGYGRVVEKNPAAAFDFADGVSSIVAEPEVLVAIRNPQKDRIRYAFGAGYRLGNRANGFEPSATGFTVTTSIQFMFK